MNAFLLAAGYGSRLGNITLSTPKCLLKVGEHTMLEHWIQKLDQLGVKHFFINTERRGYFFIFTKKVILLVLRIIL